MLESITGKYRRFYDTQYCKLYKGNVIGVFARYMRLIIQMELVSDWNVFLILYRVVLKSDVSNESYDSL